MPAVRKASKRSSKRSAPYSKTRSSATSKRVSKFASSRVRYDRQVVESPSVGLGQAAHTRIRTFGHIAATLGATGIFTGYLKPGSCFDPFGDIGTPQPNLFDVWKGVYARYLVIGATVKITVSSQTSAATTAANGGTLVAYPFLNSAAKTTLQDAASQPYAKSVCYGGGGTDPKTLYFKLDHKKVLGKYAPLDSISNGSAVTSDPVVGQFMVLPVFFQSNYIIGTSGAITFQVEIVQDVWFDRRINVNDVIE